MERLKELLRTPLLTLSGSTLTPVTILVGLVVVAAALLFASLVARGAERVLKGRGLSEGARFAIGKLIRYTVILTGLFVALSSMGFNVSAVLAASTVLLVGIGFGLQNIAQNFISGLILLFEQPVRKGDFIQVQETTGTVQDVGLRATRVLTRDAVTIIVPNSQFITESVINFSQPTGIIRVSVGVGVAYGSDTDRVKQVLLTVARSSAAVLPDPPPSVRFDDFGESSLDFTLLVWVSEPLADLNSASELRFAIDRAFREAKIEIPFPQRDLHLRSGLEKWTG